MALVHEDSVQAALFELEKWSDSEIDIWENLGDEMFGNELPSGFSAFEAGVRIGEKAGRGSYDIVHATSSEGITFCWIGCEELALKRIRATRENIRAIKIARGETVPE